MNNFLNIIPITVIVAIIIFFIKEILEYFRRKNSESRKNDALRKLLAIECERNHWTIKSLRRALDSVEDALSFGEDGKIEASIDRSGMMHFKTTILGSWGTIAITPAHKSLQEKHILEAASLDRKLFEALTKSYDATIELEHIRDSLYDNVIYRHKEEMDHLDGFNVYATSVINECYNEISNLYKICAGKILIIIAFDKDRI